eukprot:13752342-Ditylum_brightwellii.AAC.1
MQTKAKLWWAKDPGSNPGQATGCRDYAHDVPMTCRLHEQNQYVLLPKQGGRLNTEPRPEKNGSGDRMKVRRV